jgi:hypothetical protein
MMVTKVFYTQKGNKIIKVSANAMGASTEYVGKLPKNAILVSKLKKENKWVESKDAQKVANDHVKAQPKEKGPGKK